MSEPTTMTQTSPIEGGTLVCVAGDVDMSSSPTLRTELLMLLKQNKGKMIIDLSKVSFMDSSGVATMVEALRQQRAANAKMVLFGMQPRVRSIFEISRLDSLFEIVDDQDAAMNA